MSFKGWLGVPSERVSSGFVLVARGSWFLVLGFTGFSLMFFEWVSKRFSK